MKKKFLAVPIVVFVALALFFAAGPIADLLDPEREARELYEEAVRLYEERNYGLAIEKAEMLRSQHPDSEYFTDARILLVDAYAEWSDELIKAGNYEVAIEKLQTMSDKNYYWVASGVTQEFVMERFVVCYYNWGVMLQGEERFEEAIEKYGQVILNEYCSLGNLTAADDGIQSCYYEWAKALVMNGAFNEALQKYSILLEAYDSNWLENKEKAEAILSHISADVLFTSATEFREDEAFNTSITLYTGIVWFHEESVYVQDAKRAVIETEIEKIYFNEEHGTMSLPSGSEKELGGVCELTIVNDSPYVLAVFFSGPETVSITINASPESHVKALTWMILPFQQAPEEAERETFILTPGNYKVAFKTSEIAPSYGEWSIPSDTSYNLWFYIKRSY
jgi:tetratricopeptide (TPR) repeat protein